MEKVEESNQTIENTEKTADLKEKSAEEKELELIKYKFLNESQELFKKHEKAIVELSIYKWAVRSFFAVVLGGSILGFLKYQEYLDGRISERIVRLDRFNYAISLIRSNNHRQSLFELVGLEQLIDKSGYASTSEFKQTYYYYLLMAFTGIFDLNGENFVGQEQWDYLSKTNQEFFRLYVLGTLYDSDSVALNSLGICFLKYDISKSSLGKARSKFNKAYNVADINDYKAVAKYNLAMLDIIEGNKSSAIENFKKATSLSPKLYPPNSLILDDIGMSGGEFQMFVIAAKRVGNNNFKDTYKKIVSELNSKP
jgi:hypothetical protein